MSNWIDFRDEGASASGITRLWAVVAKQDGFLLGLVKWYGPWRKYAFYPSNALFEQDCLRDIATFIETKTKLHRQANAAHKLHTA